MFDIGWSELIVIAVVALVAIGPKELPGVLRMVGQWMGKVRRMAAEFQGQFNEAMREAEMTDIKKQFDEIKDTAKSFTGANLLADAQKDVADAFKYEDKPAETTASSATAAPDAASSPTEPAMPEPPSPAPLVEAETHTAAPASVADPDATRSDAPSTAGTVKAS